MLLEGPSDDAADFLGVFRRLAPGFVPGLEHRDDKLRRFALGGHMRGQLDEGGMPSPMAY